MLSISNARKVSYDIVALLHFAYFSSVNVTLEGYHLFTVTR